MMGCLEHLHERVAPRVMRMDHRVDQVIDINVCWYRRLRIAPASNQTSTADEFKGQAERSFSRLG